MSFSFFVFILLPILELTTFILVGKGIGWGETLLLTLTTSLIGIVVTRSQWIRTQSVRSGDGLSPALHPILSYLGGILLISPGFITDVIGALLLFPFGRRIVTGFFRKFILKGNSGRFSFPFGANPFFSGGFYQNGRREDFDDASTFDAEVRTPSREKENDESEVIDVDFTVRGR